MGLDWRLRKMRTSDVKAVPGSLPDNAISYKSMKGCDGLRDR